MWWLARSRRRSDAQDFMLYSVCPYSTRAQKGLRHAEESHEATQVEVETSQKHPAHESAGQKTADGSEGRCGKSETEVVAPVQTGDRSSILFSMRGMPMSGTRPPAA